jgi:hypothetical protein
LQANSQGGGAATAAGQAVAEALTSGQPEAQAYASALATATASGGCGAVGNVLASAEASAQASGKGDALAQALAQSEATAVSQCLIPACSTKPFARNCCTNRWGCGAMIGSQYRVVVQGSFAALTSELAASCLCTAHAQQWRFTRGVQIRGVQIRAVLGHILASCPNLSSPCCYCCCCCVSYLQCVLCQLPPGQRLPQGLPVHRGRQRQVQLRCLSGRCCHSRLRQE